MLLHSHLKSFPKNSSAGIITRCFLVGGYTSILRQLCLVLLVCIHAAFKNIRIFVKIFIEWFILSCRGKKYTFRHMIIDSLFLKGPCFVLYQQETGSDTNICHLKAHVSCPLSHMSEHAFTQFGLVGARPRPIWDSFWPPFPSSSVTPIQVWFQIWSGWA